MKKYIVLFLIGIMACTTMQAQKCLKPISQIEQNIWGKKYFDNWYRNDALQMLVFPSFWEPTAIYIYPSNSEDGKSNTIVTRDEKSEHKFRTNKTTVNKLYDLLEHAIKTSSYLNERMGLDGTQFFFFCYGLGATCWSPIGNCRALVNVLAEVATAADNNNQAKIDSLTSEIDSLDSIFKQYYPDDYFASSAGFFTIVETDGSQHMKVRITSSQLKVEWTFTPEEFNDAIPDQLQQKYGPMLQRVAHTVFLQSSLLSSTVLINVVHDEAARYKRTGVVPTTFGTPNVGYLRFNIHEDDLTEETLMEIIKCRSHMSE